MMKIIESFQNEGVIGGINSIDCNKNGLYLKFLHEVQVSRMVVKNVLDCYKKIE